MAEDADAMVEETLSKALEKGVARSVEAAVDKSGTVSSTTWSFEAASKDHVVDETAGWGSVSGSSLKIDAEALLQAAVLDDLKTTLGDMDDKG